MAQKQFRARICGHVQGVGYRFFARETANQFGITGYVRNLPDGSVEVLAESEEDVLKEFLELLKDGPRSARVTDAEVTWEEPSEEYDHFLVKP